MSAAHRSSLTLILCIGKVAIVTGSSRSIGASIVRALAVQGANVVVNYVNNANAATKVVDEINALGKGKAIAAKGDATNLADGRAIIDETIKAFGRLDILVLNAGIMGSKTISDITEEDFDSHIQANVKGPLFMAKAALDHLPSPGGRIIFFSSSLTAASAVLPNALCYVASKGAVEQLSRVLAKDLGAKGLTVNTVSPGPVNTPLFTNGKPPQVIEMIKSLNPSKRLGEPDDISPIVTFLASPAAQWVNGQNLRVNGGFVV
ncbi:NAD(P)-binding protein [Cylindrobasidium torrendii FP15055 ss-10]|uniref:NAD(P)-binding protein n=1 Tax=Cylindrobasidium torrendii FP15055 ss-10 TaxID=1314674 RepID=A0A0D7B773_9AGAR|nr:NAD(P)-binding protein [Cylindrobasidium torrendii FP15055 ss-10]